MPASFLPLADLFAPQDWLTLLDVSLTGIHLVRPLYGPAGTGIVDFALEYLNPAAQRMAGLAEQPGSTLLGCFPHTAAAGVLAYYQRVFETGEQLSYETNYQADGLDNYFKLCARRSGERLVVSFTDTSEQPRSVVEKALRASQAAEQAARAEAERQRGELERVFDQAPVGIAVFRGPTYIVDHVNPTLARMWGRTREQLLGKGVYETLPEAAGLGYEELMDNVMATGVPYAAHARASRHVRDGHLDTLYWDFGYVPMYAADGGINGVLVVATDATAQVEARHQVEQLNQQLEARVQRRTQELAQQRTRLERLVQEAPAAICTLAGPNLVFELVNAEYEALFPGRQLKGRPILDVLPELLDGPNAPLLRQVQQTGVTFEGREVRMEFARPADGQLEARYFDFICQARYDTAGTIDGLVLFGFEVTEKVLARQQTEAMLTESLHATARRAQERQDLLEVFAHAPLAVALLREPGHQLDYWNSLFDEFFPGARRGVSLREALPALATAQVIAQLDRLYQSGETYQSEDTLLPSASPDAAPRYVTFTYQAYRENGRIAGVALFMQEVTEQVLIRQQVQDLNQELVVINEELTSTNEELASANEDLNESNAQLTRTNVDLDTFVYTASHDLKAPIVNIEGLLTALREHLPADTLADATTSQILGMMQGATERFRLTIDQLTDISRLQQAQRLPREYVQLAPVVEHVRLDLAPLQEATGAQLHLDVGLEMYVQCAPKNLRSVVYNLLSNAIKYRHPDRLPVVHLRAVYADNQAVLTVQDNGLGLTVAQQQQLFSLFQRLHTHVEGTGVGLYMVKRMVENAGGTIAVQSEEGVGTTFTVCLQR